MYSVVDHENDKKVQVMVINHPDKNRNMVNRS